MLPTISEGAVMARVVETEEPVVTREREVIPDDGARSYTGVIIAVVVLVILLLLLLWRPWGGSGTGGANINVQNPTTSSP
jgi:hypothetical protein